MNDTFKETVVIVRLHCSNDTVLFPVQVFTEHDPRVVAQVHVKAIFKEDQ